MSSKSKKQFGVWMDSHHATIIGKENENFVVIAKVLNEGASNNSNENTANNEEIALTQKFFKAIAEKMQNIDALHITGTGQIQEQFSKFLSNTPQYKNAVAENSTSNKMSDDALINYIGEKFN